MTGRHIDTTARMLWLTLRNRSAPIDAAGLVDYWRPTFSIAEVEDALMRLEANGLARKIETNRSDRTWTVGSAWLPGAEVERGRAAA